MILIIPALQLIDGHCSLFVKGEAGTKSLYHRLSDRPAELCSLWRRENAKTIHITDYDSNYTKIFSNLDSIIFLADTVDIPFQVLANMRSVKECRYLLDNGIYRIAFGQLMLTDPEGVKELVKEYTPSRVVGYVETINGKVKFAEFKNVCKDVEFIEEIKELGVQRIIYKDETWLNKDVGVNFDKLKQIGSDTKTRITVFEGVTRPAQLWRLNETFKYGVDSLVIGKALYENNFPCQKIWRMIEAELEK